MEAWEETRIDRLEERLKRIERKEWERREFVLRLLMVAVVLLSIAAVVLSATHPGH